MSIERIIHYSTPLVSRNEMENMAYPGTAAQEATGCAAAAAATAA